MGVCPYHCQKRRLVSPALLEGVQGNVRRWMTAKCIGFSYVLV